MSTEYDNFDTKAAAVDIAKDLFTGTPKSDVVSRDSYESPDIQASVVKAEEKPVIDTTAAEKPAIEAKPTEKPAIDPNAPAPRVEPGVNSEVDVPLPKSWKKEMEGDWKNVSPSVKKYVAEREAQVMRGIQQYAGGYNNWEQLIKPFVPVLSQNPEVNPINLMQGLLNTHLQLLNPAASNERKAQMVTQLLQEYGINLGDPAQIPQIHPDVSALRQEINTLKQQQQRNAQITYQESVKGYERQIEAFGADPKNKYFSEVGMDIIRLIQTGAATDLASAYDQACWTNPAVRAKLLADQQDAAKPTATPARKPNGQFVNIDEGPVGKVKQKPISIENTIDNVVAKHFPTKH